MIEQLYTIIAPELHRYLLKVARDINEADDLLQDTFLRALSNISVLQTLSRPKQRAWLYTTARRCLIDRRREEKRECSSNDIILGEANDDLSIPFVAEALGSLPEHLRTIVSMRYFTGMDSAAIGKILGIPPATVRTRLRAGVKKLRCWINK